MTRAAEGASGSVAQDQVIPEPIHTSYPAWSLATYRQRVAPILAQVEAGEPEVSWLAACGPGVGEHSQFRLFPGSLFLLWLQALGGATSDAHIHVAASLECLHNASLHHDDALDAHGSRRGIETLLAAGGPSRSLLEGDALVGIGFGLAAAAVPTVVGQLAAAWTRMTRGQVLDEPSTWHTVPECDRAGHWERTTRDKLALGNVAGPLGAVCAGQEALAAEIGALHESFSVVSQVMNDVGDAEEWAGFHVVAKCTRGGWTEAARKPTFATIHASATLAEADREIESRTATALKGLAALPVSQEARHVLRDFFTRPLAEFRRVTEGGLHVR